MSINEILRALPSVDEVLKGEAGLGWLARYPRRFVVQGIRQALDARRAAIVNDRDSEPQDPAALTELMDNNIRSLSALSLRSVINATGIVIHTNLGRSCLSDTAIDNIAKVARGYSNLEYDLAKGARGKRYDHIRSLLCTVTGAEDAVVVNNNAAAVLVCLSALARGREVIVSRGELVEIGGSFRVPEVMEQGGARLREVGSTNKTHLHDYEAAYSDDTGLLLKVHQSNYRICGFTGQVSVAELKELGSRLGVPVMYDMGSGCLHDLKPYGIHSEPTVQEVVREEPDVLTFSGDKLLGGPQAGIIAGRTEYIQKIARHPLMRAMRIDKLTLAALESTLYDYVDDEGAGIPTMRMLLEPADAVKKRAQKLAREIRRQCGDIAKVVRDVTYAGGGSLPTDNIDTWAVSLSVKDITPNEIEEALRLGEPAVVARIKDDALMLDARTLADADIRILADCVNKALKQ